MHLEITTFLAEALESGKITVSENRKTQIEIQVTESKKIDVNATDKQLIKEVISGARGAGGKQGLIKSIQRSAEQIRTARRLLPVVKYVVEDLRKEGVTVKFYYKGDRFATVGTEANSKLTRILTGTRGIEINSPRRLAQLNI